MKSQSIHRKLVRSLSLSLTLVIILILLITDIAVDKWVHEEFERAMENKVKLLSTLVSESKTGLSFDFAGEFMPEFESDNSNIDLQDIEYFQLWHQGSVFERSQTLDLFNNKSFKLKDIPMGIKQIYDINLPDGRSGMIVYYRFIPQVHSETRADFKQHSFDTGYQQTPVLLAYAMSTEKLNFVEYLIDVSFVVAALFVVLMVRFLVTKAVKSGLQPLRELTDSLKGISLADTSTELMSSQQVDELQPIQKAINTFINENKALYQKEQRLSSDIAHELKTPIAELVSMAEVALKFPNDESFNKTFTPDVLATGKRLQNIVSNILLLHRFNSVTFGKDDVFDPIQVLSRLIEQNKVGDRISLMGSVNPITSNLFAFETIFSNLINNALTYSPSDSEIQLNVKRDTINTLCINISNECLVPLDESDLSAMFDPLWQKDSARTSTNNYGLGLSIVSSFCKALSANIDVKLIENNLVFQVSIPDGA